ELADLEFVQLVFDLLAVGLADGLSRGVALLGRERLAHGLAREVGLRAQRGAAGAWPWAGRRAGMTTGLRRVGEVEHEQRALERVELRVLGDVAREVHATLLAVEPKVTH